MARNLKTVDHYFTANPKSKPRYGLIKACICGRYLEFLTASGVFSKHRIDPGTRLLIESMVLPKEGSILDLGCGYGAVGIAAAVFNPHLHVVLVDPNSRAVTLTRHNLQRNSVDNAEVKHGCFYSPVKDLSFNCVLSNPPVSAGMDTVKLMITEAPQHLVPGGVLQMVLRSKIGGKRILTSFKDAFGNVEILSRQSGYRVLSATRE